MVHLLNIIILIKQVQNLVHALDILLIEEISHFSSHFLRFSNANFYLMLHYIFMLYIITDV